MAEDRRFELLRGCPQHARSSPADSAARLAACQIFAVCRTLAEDNRRCLVAGATARERYPGAVEAAGQALALLRHGLADHTNPPTPACRHA
jgi:hypothetical protein